MKYTTLILSLVSLLAGSLSAQVEKPAVPTEIESEYLQMENDGEKAYFLATGNVILTATNLELICDKLELFVTQTGDKEATIGSFGDFEQIIATGNVKITQAERIARAGLVEMDPENEQIILKDNPSVTQSGTTLSGLEIIIKRGKGIVIVPGSEKHKVRFIGPSIKDLGFESDKKIEEKKPESSEDPVEESDTDEKTDSTETSDSEPADDEPTVDSDVSSEGDDVTKEEESNTRTTKKRKK